MKKTYLLARLCLTFLLMGMLSNSQAQQCTLVNSLGLNTGVNITTGALLPIGTVDPVWIVTSLTPAMTAAGMPISTPIGTGALSITRQPVDWGLNNVSNYVSCYATNNPSTPAPGIYQMTITRTFRTCILDSFTFNLNLAADNRITAISIDGGASVFNQPPPPIPGYLQFNTVPAFGVTLAPGTHTIDVTVDNQFITGTDNWFGVSIFGTMTGQLNSIISDTSAQNCQCPPPPPNCSDTCFWKVSGNTIVNGWNILGTLNNQDMRLFSNNTQRGVIKSNGYYGWRTTSPTTFTHIECTNPQGVPSGLRLENLPFGLGADLVVDANGYVFRKDRELGKANFEDKASELEKEIADLKGQIKTLLERCRACNEPAIATRPGNILYQNKPNPFDNTTLIEYTVSNVKSDAAIIIYDLSGKELLKFRTARSGKGSVQISASQLPKGMYLYSLVIDGTEVETKKMVLSGN